MVMLDDVASCATVQVSAPLQDHPGALIAPMTNAAGTASVIVTSAASLGPALLTVSVYVIGPPATADAGALLARLRSDCQTTSDTSSALLSLMLGSDDV